MSAVRHRITNFNENVKNQGSSPPKPDVKTKYEKNFFDDFHSAVFWQKLYRFLVNKIAMKSFFKKKKKPSFGVNFKL